MTTIMESESFDNDHESLQVGIDHFSMIDRTEWNRAIQRLPQGSVFHRSEALFAIRNHSGSTLQMLTGYIDGTLVGGLPVFIRSIGPATAVFSQPPGLGIPEIGPWIDIDSVQTGNHVLFGEAFMSQCWSKIHSRFDPEFIRLAVPRTVPLASLDLRDRTRITPRFTYLLDLAPDEEELLAGFSSDARRNIRSTDKNRVELVEGDRYDIERIIDTMIDRYEEQDLTYPVQYEFVLDLYEELPEGMVRPYVIEVDGQFVTGVIALDDGTTVYRWQGGGKTPSDVPVNDLLDWHIISEAVGNDRAYYDFVGANTPGISSYKAKFNPELVPGYQIERSTPVMRFIRDLYRWLRKRGVSPARLLG